MGGRPRRVFSASTLDHDSPKHLCGRRAPVAPSASGPVSRRGAAKWRPALPTIGGSQPVRHNKAMQPTGLVALRRHLCLRAAPARRRPTPLHLDRRPAADCQPLCRPYCGSGELCGFVPVAMEGGRRGRTASGWTSASGNGTVIRLHGGVPTRGWVLACGHRAPCAGAALGAGRGEDLVAGSREPHAPHGPHSFMHVARLACGGRAGIVGAFFVTRLPVGRDTDPDHDGCRARPAPRGAGARLKRSSADGAHQPADEGSEEVGIRIPARCSAVREARWAAALVACSPLPLSTMIHKHLCGRRAPVAASASGPVSRRGPAKWRPALPTIGGSQPVRHNKAMQPTVLVAHPRNQDRLRRSAGTYAIAPLWRGALP